MVYIQEMNDPLGFTKEVGLLLTGLGCSNLTKFKEKNIGFEDLKELTDEDLNVLEVGDKFDHVSFKKFCSNYRKRFEDPEPDVQDIFTILKESEKQLKVIIIYLQFVTIQISKHNDIFVEMDKNLKYSDGLRMACEFLDEEIKELQSEIKSLEEFDEDTYHNNKKKKIFYCIEGLGILAVIYILTKKFYFV